MRQNYFPFEHLPAVVYKTMGRGRKGVIEQSSKKPKAQKNRERGFIWGMHKIDNPHYEKDNSEFLTEGLIAEMKKMSPQNLMNILLPSEDTQEINKKLSQRKALGWDKVNEAITKAPFCEHNQQIVNLLFCYECKYCKWNGLCHKCKKNGDDHFLGCKYYKKDYDDIFNVPYIYYRPKKIYYENGIYYEDISIIINFHNFNHHKFAIHEDGPDSLKNRNYEIYVIE